MTSAIATLLGRLEVLIDGSIAAMQSGRTLDDRAIADAKGRVLLELSRLGARAPRDLTLANDVRRLRSKLAQEEALLARRLDAARLIAEIVTEAVLASESDGTYDSSPTGVGRRLPSSSVEGAK
ncbi:hypothetical protein [Acuticoccus sp.]|uniref:hypothetical protein n=1 Tax=Acuticoccus sp. TaxID=1904378 RepID=UPI003B52E905